MLLLDEPTNDLDFAAETHLMAVFKSLATVKTIIMVTHSVRLMSICDKIIYLDKASKLHVGATPEMLKLLYGISVPKPVPAAPKAASQVGTETMKKTLEGESSSDTGGKAAQA